MHRLVFGAIGLVYSVPNGAGTLTQTSRDSQAQPSPSQVTFHLCPVTLPVERELCHLVASPNVMKAAESGPQT